MSETPAPAYPASKPHPAPNPVTTERPPAVTVIIPTFNRAHCVGDAIRSALAQTNRDLEVIVMDDGSKDATPEVVARFGDQIRYFWNENRGKSAALNLALPL